MTETTIAPDTQHPPAAPPPYRQPTSRMMSLLRAAPWLATPMIKFRLSRMQRMDGPFDGSDLMPPGATRPAPYPGYYLDKQVHGMPQPGWLHPAMGHYTAETSKLGFYFNRDEVIDHWYPGVFGPVAPKRILDVGCGPGIATRALARLFPEAEVTGIDLSPPILRWARRDAEEKGIRNVHFYHGDFGDLRAWPDGHFDAVIESYVFHEVPAAQSRVGIGEMIRVTRPGGRLVFVDWPPPETEAEYQRRVKFLTITEPYMLEYLALDLENYLVEQGLENVTRHTVVVRNMLVTADKPA